MKRNLVLIALVVLALVLVGAAAISLPILTTNSAVAAQLPNVQVNPPQVVVAPQLTSGTLADLEATFEQIYTQVNPSVVTIHTVQAVTVPTLPDSFFGSPQLQQPQQQIQQALGSGFVWDTQGHIITNSHVVDGADQIAVTFADGTTVTGKVIGADPASDLAVIQVSAPANELHPVQLADSTQVKVGEIAIAIGNPFGEQNTMTTGIISAIGRSLPVNDGTSPGPSYTIPDVIQTDAPINPGNSGGVLLDTQGRVIGVTSAIESPVRASAGIGFAIPSSIVNKVVPTLIKTGHYDHPWLGIGGTTLTSDLAKAMNLDANQRGALVEDVTPGSPADKAGVRGSAREINLDSGTVNVGGDVITAFNGQPVKTFDDLVAALEDSSTVGQSVTLTILRDGKQQTLNVTVAVRPKTTPENQVTSKTNPNVSLGLRGMTLTPLLAQAMNLSLNQKGVLVESVEAHSPADKAGLQGSYGPVLVNGRALLIGGDIITALNGHAVTTVRELQTALQSYHAGDTVTLTILRAGKPMEVQVTLG